ncbi:uncharacterized [Tachysurus ichikawai]
MFIFQTSPSCCARIQFNELFHDETRQTTCVDSLRQRRFQKTSRPESESSAKRNSSRSKSSRCQTVRCVGFGVPRLASVCCAVLRRKGSVT